MHKAGPNWTSVWPQPQADVHPPQAHLGKDGVEEWREDTVSHSSGWEAVTCVGNNLLRNHSNTHVAALDWPPTRHLLSSLISCGLQKNNTKLIKC